MTKWRYVEDKKYGGYNIQKQKRFLFFSWWVTKHYCPNKNSADKIIAIEQLKKAL